MTDYITDEAEGQNWRLLLGDSCERLAEISSETVDLSICSPPFASLFTYSPSVRDLGNASTRGEFLEHYGFIIREQLRVTKPGRLACIHVQQLTTSKSTHGYMGMTDFRGEVIRAFQDGGWQFNGEVTVWKDPQAQSIRTRSHALAFATKNRDSAGTRPALADYLLLFKKPGDNAVQIKNDVTNDEWIEWASPIWTDHHDGGWLTEDGNICPVWYGIRETDTLNTKVAKDSQDERHICLANGSLVLTQEHGYIPIETVDPGLHVLTHAGRWRRVINRRCNGTAAVVRTTAQGVADLRTTPDHKLWTRRATSKWAEKKSAMSNTPEWVAASDTVSSYVNLPLAPVEESELTAQEWWIVGRWLGDGHHGGHKRSGTRDGKGQFIISCSHDEAAELTERLGVHAGHSATVTATQIAVVNLRPEVRDVLSRCGKGATNKHLPAEAFTLNAELSESLLDGYLSADGHYVEKHNRTCASSVSRALLLGVAMVAQRARGVVASVYAGRPARTGEIQGRTVNMSQDWILAFRESPGYRQSGWIGEDGAWKKVRRVENAGEAEVWDLQIEGDESFVAEGAVVHNCPLQLGFIERCVRLWSNPGELVLTPFAGIGSELYQSVKLGRRAIGIELKPSYWRTAVDNLTELESEMDVPSLFDEAS
jgi:hypothetical protein